jgi:hypothetical protein
MVDISTITSGDVFMCRGFTLDITPGMQVTFLHRRSTGAGAVTYDGITDAFHEIDGYEIIGLEIDRPRVGRELRGLLAIGTSPNDVVTVNTDLGVILLPLAQCLQVALDIHRRHPMRVVHTIAQS